MAEGSEFIKIAKYVASVLRSLGYRVSLKKFPKIFPAYAYAADSRNEVDILGLWFVGFDPSAPGNFAGLTCDSISRADPDNGNVGLFCDPDVDSHVQHAIEVQITDPAAAAPLWASIDREVTLKAPWIFLFTPGGVDLVSKRVGNYQHNPAWGILLSQLWLE